MFDVGFAELILIAVIALVVLGPERLPVVAKKLGHFMGGLRKTFVGFQHEFQRHTQVVEESAKEVIKVVDAEIDYGKKVSEDVKQQVTSDKLSNADNNELDGTSYTSGGEDV